MGKIGTVKADFAAASGNEGEQVWNRSELTGKSLGKFVLYITWTGFVKGRRVI